LDTHLRRGHKALKVVPAARVAAVRLAARGLLEVPVQQEARLEIAAVLGQQVPRGPVNLERRALAQRDEQMRGTLAQVMSELELRTVSVMPTELVPPMGAV